MPTWELIGDDNELTWVYANTHTWELTLIHLRGNAFVQWVYTNTHMRELNRYRPDQTGTDQTRQTHFKSFQCIDKPRGASPRRNYVRSEEDGISTNRII